MAVLIGRADMALTIGRPPLLREPMVRREVPLVVGRLSFMARGVSESSMKILIQLMGCRKVTIG
jgi:hypothetical protein